MAIVRKRLASEAMVFPLVKGNHNPFTEGDAGAACKLVQWFALLAFDGWSAQTQRADNIASVRMVLYNRD